MTLLIRNDVTPEPLSLDARANGRLSKIKPFEALQEPLSVLYLYIW